MGLIPPAVFSSSEDRWVWEAENDRVYSVKLAYDLLLHYTLVPDPRAPLETFKQWKSFAPTRVIDFSWHLDPFERLPTRENLFRKQVIPDVSVMGCVLCGGQFEHKDALVFVV